MSPRTVDAQTKMDEAITGQEAGDYALAITKAISALGLLSTTPDSTGAQGNAMTWSREAVEAFIGQVKSQQVGSRGVLQRANITYVPTTDEVT